MQGVATEKVPGGKLLRIKVDYDDKINNVKITGDFFIHPEESVTEIENLLKGTKKDEDEKIIADKISKLVFQKNIQLVGIDPVAISRVTKAAMA
jgi:lipoate-protein ligase A